MTSSKSDVDDASPTIINFYRVAERVKAHGLFAEVWMTGGGVHTLHAGPTGGRRPR